jgi:hypothetical protein
MAAAVDGGLQVAKQRWRVLNLVDDDRRRVAVEEYTRLILGEFGFAREVEGDEAVGREKAAESGCFARLPRTRQDDGGAGAGCVEQSRLDISHNPHG